MCGGCVRRVDGSLCGFTGLVCVWMLSVLSGVCRVFLARLVCVARKARRGRLVLTVLRVLLGLLVRRVPRV